MFCHCTSVTLNTDFSSFEMSGMKCIRLSFLRVLHLFGLGLLLSCSTEDPTGDALFTLLEPSRTGIRFENNVSYTESFNVYTYRNFYNGAGVGIGDLNNDGLADVFFCGNMEDNRLYLNRGDFQFEDITEQAGVASKGVWSTGVSIADVNGDGWLDIYVCKSGNPEGENRHNELFINNGDLTFTESSAAYGLNDKGLSTHAAFFDYDKDGDLDCYLLNNSFRSVGGYDLRPGQREVRDPEGGNKLYRNDGGSFVDVSEEAGIYGSNIGFGLGVTIGDINRDGWQDIYVSNDFFEKDYLYINNQDGTFAEQIDETINELSMGSMGADMADINNDGWPEVFVTEMLPESNARLKTKSMFESWDKYRQNITNGYHRQFSRNVLQLNLGTMPQLHFSEISRYAGVEATDWSWGALLFDMDNDGYKDIFVANGIYKDLLDQDYINYMADEETVRSLIASEGDVITQLVDAMPSEALSNYAFRNLGELRFANSTADWGLDAPSFSNGSAYGDLDNDGDLDLIVNNVNMPPFVYRNTSETTTNRSLSILLRYKDKNPFGIGSFVTVYAGESQYFQELAPMRGFQSNVDYRLVFGLGTQQADSVEVVWPDLTSTVITDVTGDIIINYDPQDERIRMPAYNTLLQPGPDIEFTHKENGFVDFDQQRLLFHMRTNEGPAMAVSDINGDGLDDFYIGGARGQSGRLMLGAAKGVLPGNSQVFSLDKACEDTDAYFIDVDNDGDQDLYVASGSLEFGSAAASLLDRLYLNDGTGVFTKATIPARFISTSSVAAGDIDQDGDMDIVLGERGKSFLHGIPTDVHVLINRNGTFAFKDMPSLSKLGMITDVQLADFTGNGALELLVAGEWMPLTVFRWDGETFVKSTSTNLDGTEGWWNTIEVADLDADGDLDFAAGNLGLNTRLRASSDRPAKMYINDFDGNGQIEQVITCFNGDQAFPFLSKGDLVMQLPALKKKYLKFESFENQTLRDVFDTTILNRSIVHTIRTTESSIFINTNGSFQRQKMPVSTQFSPIFAIKAVDIDADDDLDLVLGGNQHRARPEMGIYAASFGNILMNTQSGFTDSNVTETGFFVPGEIRSIHVVNGLLVIARNDDQLITYERKK